MNSPFRTHIPQYGQPHFDVADPSLTVLMILSRGYSVRGAQWISGGKEMASFWTRKVKSLKKRSKRNIKCLL